ncbi:hypothetical protein K2173_003638 [Erythroxylum novogranatense]|uniref:Retrotransposon Copia-like N-terminal domain-containing protein n=1 Tax=Erythroxylum novogranatense TaxID=1862640 RepID=A0AAV8TAI9_9ROSI|nr:hypothetical protein K2173_003638 [Erythroxylum novogranatense]
MLGLRAQRLLSSLSRSLCTRALTLNRIRHISIDTTSILQAFHLLTDSITLSPSSICSDRAIGTLTSVFFCNFCHSAQTVVNEVGGICYIRLFKIFIMASSSNSGGRGGGVTNTTSRRASHASVDSVSTQMISVKLNGTKNYSEWAQAMRTALEARNKLKFISSDPPHFNSREFESWQADDCLVMLWLWNSMDTSVSCKVMHLVTAKEVWKKVRDLYSTENNESEILDISSELALLSVRDDNSASAGSSSWQNSYAGRLAANRGGYGGNSGRRSGGGRGRGGFRKCTLCGGENHTVDTCRDMNWNPWESKDRVKHYASPTTEKWKAIQNVLKKRLITVDDFSWTLPMSNSRSSSERGKDKGCILKYVGGVDVSFLKEDSSIACATLVVLELSSLQVVYQDFSHVKLHVPYVPGFLAFREAPILLELLEKMKNKNSSFYPQILMVDGNGILHPRGFGLACQLGVLANIPTIGIGKNLHYVDGITEAGVWRLLQDGENTGEKFLTLTGRSGRTWAAVMRPTEDTSKPIFISIGHRISLETATEIVKMTCKFRVPEPVRQADIRSRDYIQKHKREMLRNVIS